MVNINSEQETNLLACTKGTFEDYRNKYNNAIVKFVNDYKELRYSLHFFFYKKYYHVNQVVLIFMNLNEVMERKL